MRLVLMMASVLIVSILIFKGYGNDLGNQNTDRAATQKITPLKKAEDTNQLVLDAAITQRQELEKQIQ